jgi:cytidylate kinase
MVILGNQPGVLRVRLDGDIDARIERVAEIEKIDLDAARVMQRETDGARDHYLRLFYRVRQDDFTLYDLMIDTTEIPLETCTELIVLAAKAKSAAR